MNEGCQVCQAPKSGRLDFRALAYDAMKRAAQRRPCESESREERGIVGSSSSYGLGGVSSSGSGFWRSLTSRRSSRSTCRAPHPSLFAIEGLRSSIRATSSFLDLLLKPLLRRDHVRDEIVVLARMESGQR